MPIYTVYTYIFRPGKRKLHKYKTIAIYTYYEEIISYQDLKDNVLHNAARYAYFNHELTVTELFIKKHLGGKYKRATTSYRASRTHINSQDEFSAKITYNPKTDKIKVENAQFVTPHFFQFKQEYDIEKRRSWQPAPVVTPGFTASLLNPNLIWTDLVKLKTPMLKPTIKDVYGSKQEKSRQQGPYAATSKGLYAGRMHTVEVDKQQRDNEI